MSFEVLWYIVIGAAMLFYTVLDGFDLGVGGLHLFARTDEQRRIFLNAIGPVWDGNEVWIVVVMGALFAGFPGAYASLFSGFYSLLMFLIAGLMFRAAAIEFRSKRDSKRWRAIWDIAFALSSILVGLVLGIILGNAVQGIPIDANQNFAGHFSDFLRPYPIIVGITSMALFTMHGTIYLAMKTEGETHEIVRRWITPAILSFIIWYAITTVATFIYQPHMLQRFLAKPQLSIFPVLALLAILNIPYQARKNNHGWAFISSCLSIVLLLILFSLGTFPFFVYSTLNPAYSLTIYNTASTHKTLGILLIIVGIGIPLVLAYGFWVYRIFRGKVRLDKSSY
jgi:cytochrome d ubiquinol oxidase subunit II